MAHRKEVFQSKVLQKLYPAIQEVVTEQSPPHIVEALGKKKPLKSKARGEGAASGAAVKRQSAAKPGRRIYTVLPPPADYDIHSEESVSLQQLKSINSVEEPAEGNNHESDEVLDEEQEAEEQRRRRRRKRKKKGTICQDSGNDEATPGSESCTGQSQTAVDEGAERISRNKKRKLKKKRHKQKLLSMGLMPRAAALEFTYQKDGEEEEGQEEDERRAAEVSDFLRTTMEMYLSDSSSHASTIPDLSATVDGLLGGIDGGSKPNSVLKQLYSLKTFVQQTNTDKLEKALKDLCSNSSCMSAEETAAVVTLFQYWITDILPMQGDKKTRAFSNTPMRLPV